MIENFKQISSPGRPRHETFSLAEVEKAAGLSQLLAPWPQIDRYPTILGSELSLLHISAAQRSALVGYRAASCDIYDELLEKSPHAFSKLSDRILAVAGGALKAEAALLPPGHKDAAKAAELAEWVIYWLSQIEEFQSSLAMLLWGIYYGISAAELEWTLVEREWRIKALSFIASRRLNFPDPQSWDLHVWDQGVGNFAAGTTAGWGAGGTSLRISDFPGKFIVFQPRLRATYAVRDGIGRTLSWWIALKAMGARGAGQFIERWGKPWALMSYTTNGTIQGQTGIAPPRMATQEDMDSAERALGALGTGSASGAILPDSIKATLTLVENGLTHDKFIALCNDEISKLCISQTLTTSAGKFGSKGTGETGERASMRLYKYDAQNLADAIRKYIVTPLVRANRPDQMHLLPRVSIGVEPMPTREEELDLAVKASGSGIPVSASEMAKKLGLRIVDLTAEEEKTLAMHPVQASAGPGAPEDDGEGDDDEEDDDEEDAPTGDASKPAPDDPSADDDEE
jgi:phage gp29-like protein